MSLEILDEKQFESLFLSATPLIDVRAPVEFQQGSLPNAINLPILEDDERAQVGTLYKERGPEAAVELGHKLVSGKVKDERIEKWISFIRSHRSCILYCFRGGQRSRIAQSWLAERSVNLPRIDGGYKKGRQFLIEKLDQISTDRQFLSLAGPTGSGKTILIHEIQNIYPTIDLEGLARHRGSAFGATEVSQPSQIDFENKLAIQLMSLPKSKLLPLVEDESRLVGRCALPIKFFEKISSTQVILIDEKIEVRIENIFQDYIQNSAIGRTDEAQALQLFAKYKNSLLAISKKLGSERTKEVMGLLQESEHRFREGLDSNRAWIEKLLVYYYDPMYLASLKRRDVKAIFTGSRLQCFDYLNGLL